MSEAHFYETDSGERVDFDLAEFERGGAIEVVDVALPQLQAFVSQFDASYVEKLDPGEAESLAYLLAASDDTRICSADGIVFRVLGNLDRGEQGTSLEELLQAAGLLLVNRTSPCTGCRKALVALMKQARGFGVGVVVATQNPMDLDYRALSNAGLWCLGRLQTDADRARVLDGLAAARGTEGSDGGELGNTLQRLAPRWFVVRNAHASSPPILVNPRYAMSLMRGPMTRVEIRRAREARD